MKKTMIFCVILLLFQVALLHAAEVKLTTYYPSPYGEYKKLTATDSVGIGTTNPQEALDVRGNLYLNTGDDAQHIYWMSHSLYMGNKLGDYANAVVHIQPGGASEGITKSLLMMYDASASSTNPTHTAKVQIASTGTSYLNGGNVGIGTATPTKKLEVAGDVKATGDICTDQGGGKCLSTGGGAALPGTLCGMQDTHGSTTNVMCNGYSPSVSCPGGYTSMKVAQIEGNSVYSCVKV